MSGLGRNILNGGRRSGIGLTQFGMAGLGWVGRDMPAWGSPYSAQATVALKAQFPTQWPTIRDYGFAHPEIVGYMNAYAPEDAKIAYSLVEGIGVRYITTDKNAYIDTTAKATSNTDCEIDFFNLVNVSGSEHVLFGARNGSWSANYGINGNSLGRNGIYAYYNYDGSTGITMMTEAVYKLAKGKLYINGEQRYTKTYSAFSFNLNIFIFGTNNGGSQAYSPVVSVKRFKVWESDVLTRELVPYIQGGVSGMMDLVNGVFHPKQGSGTLTISETPAA